MTKKFSDVQDRGSDAPVPGKCGAKLRGSNPSRYCTMYPLAGRPRCRYHGGKSLAGAEHPGFKGRGWSKYLPQRLGDRLGEALMDPELTSLTHELALIDVRMGELLEKLGTGDTEFIWDQVKDAVEQTRNAHTAGKGDDVLKQLDRLEELAHKAQEDRAVWNDVHGVIEQRRRLADTERKREELLGATMNAQQAMTFIAALQLAVNDEIKDSDMRTRLAQRLRVLLAHNVNVGQKALDSGIAQQEIIVDDHDPGSDSSA